MPADAWPGRGVFRRLARMDRVWIWAGRDWSVLGALPLRQVSPKIVEMAHDEQAMKGPCAAAGTVRP
jgi:hypothetical protein